MNQANGQGGSVAIKDLWVDPGSVSIRPDSHNDCGVVAVPSLAGMRLVNLKSFGKKKEARLGLRD